MPYGVRMRMIGRRPGLALRREDHRVQLHAVAHGNHHLLQLVRREPRAVLRRRRLRGDGRRDEREDEDSPSAERVGVNHGIRPLFMSHAETRRTRSTAMTSCWSSPRSPRLRVRNAERQCRSVADAVAFRSDRLRFRKSCMCAYVLQPPRVEQRLVRVVGDHDQLVGHVVRAQQLDEADRLREVDVAVVVAVPEEHRRLPLVDRRDGRRLVRDVGRVERVAAEVHAGHVDAGDEDVGVARQRLRREQAAVREAPDADARGSTSARDCRYLPRRDARPGTRRCRARSVFGAVRNELP